LAIQKSYPFSIKGTLGLLQMPYNYSLSEKKVQKPSLGLYLFKRENFCPF